jgi:hypothetical protein
MYVALSFNPRATCLPGEPLFDRVDPVKGAVRLRRDAELMPDAQLLFRDLKRYEAFDHSDKPGGWNSSEVSHLAIEEMLEHESCLAIVNTKRDALAIYTACKERLNVIAEPMEDGVFTSVRVCAPRTGSDPWTQCGRRYWLRSECYTSVRS